MIKKYEMERKKMRLGFPELVVILLIVFLVFGAKLIPKLAKASLQTVKDTKKELVSMKKENNGEIIETNAKEVEKV